MKNTAYIGVLILLPVVALAQTFDTTYLRSIVMGLGDVIDLAVPVLIAIALAIFVWGMVVFIASSASEKGREEGKRKMIWGVIALFVIISIWGLVEILQSILDIRGVSGIMPPQSDFR